MLVADPSSLCDVCYQPFSEKRECFSIPCGHVFCGKCLERLTQMVCPMCRTPLGSMRRIRKIHVDMSKSIDQDRRTIQQLRKLEETLTSEALKIPNLTYEGAHELSAKIRKFLGKQPRDQYVHLRSIVTLLDNYAIVFKVAYEESAQAKATKASYEDRIKHLERQLGGNTHRDKTENNSRSQREPVRSLTAPGPASKHRLLKDKIQPKS